jgi:hypothetical protein
MSISYILYVINSYMNFKNLTSFFIQSRNTLMLASLMCGVQCSIFNRSLFSYHILNSRKSNLYHFAFKKTNSPVKCRMSDIKYDVRCPVYDYIFYNIKFIT